MKKNALLAVVIASMVASQGVAQVSTGITYQGEALVAGTPYTGLLDARFRLFDAASGGLQVGAVLCADNIVAADGRFTTQLEFGDEYTRNPALFLEIELRTDTGATCASSAGFTVLGPRQHLTAAPYAVASNFAHSAENAANATTATTALTASNANALGGQSSAFYRNATNVNAGTLADARLSTNIAKLNAANLFTGSVTLSNPLSVLAGDGSAVSNLNAGNLATGVVSLARGGTGGDTSGASAGSVLKFSGTSWQPGVDNDTTYSAGTGLVLTGTTFEIASQGIAPGMLQANSVDTIAIAPNAIINSDISDNSITNNKLVNATLTGNKIASNTITSTNIQDGSIGNADLQASSISSVNIIDGAITTADLGASSVLGSIIADNTVTTSDIADSTILSADIAPEAITGADIATNAIGASELAVGAVSNTRLALDAASLLQVSGGAMQSSGTRIGIGSAPSATNELRVEGRIESTTGLTTTGTVTAAEFTHVTPFPRVYNISPFDFTVRDGAITLVGNTSASDYAGEPTLTNETLAVTGQGAAPLHLPDGALVTSMELMIEDDSGDNATVLLLRRSLTGAVGGTMASAVSSGAAAGIRTFADTTISAGTIDNDSWMYYVQLTLPPTPTSVLEFKGLVVRYTVSRPLP